MKKTGLVCFWCLLCQLVMAQLPLEQYQSLSEVLVIPEENPALYMIQQAARHQQTNSLRSNSSFRYIQYQKVYALADTSNRKLFLNECVTDYTYLSPDLQNSKIIASRTSGFIDPLISVWLISQQSPFFDEDRVSVIHSKVLNPISEKGLQCYDYVLRERMVVGKDTLFRIAFSPQKGRHFTALKGELWLHYPDWALQRIRASANDSIYSYPLTFEQFFVRQNNGTWAPDSIYACVGLTHPSLKNTTLNFYLYSSFRHLQLNTDLKRKDFGHADVEDQLSDDMLNELILQHYRPASLTAEEIHTYELVDSVSRAMRLSKSLGMLKSLSNGCVLIGPLDLDIAEIVNYRNVDGWRFGIGLYTNDRVSKMVSFGGYFAYALADHRWKGGGRVNLDLGTRWELKLKLKGGHDLFESGGVYHYNASYAFLSAEYFRQWVVGRFDYSTSVDVNLQMRPLRWLRVAFGTSYGQFETGYNYAFTPMSSEAGAHFRFRNFKADITLQLAFKVEQLRAGNFTIFAESPYPVVTLHYEKSIPRVFGSDFNYHKLDLNVRYRKLYRNEGYTEISLWGGITPNDLPASLLYVPMAGYAPVNFDCWEQFATMPGSTFLCDKYALVFLRHNFGKMTNNKRFSPHIILCQNMGIAGLRHPEIHQGIHFEDMSKGYFETGIIVDRLLCLMKTYSLGLGVFYHYGPYSQPKTWNNFAVKISFTIQ